MSARVHQIKRKKLDDRLHRERRSLLRKADAIMNYVETSGSNEPLSSQGQPRQKNVPLFSSLPPSSSPSLSSRNGISNPPNHFGIDGERAMDVDLTATMPLMSEVPSHLSAPKPQSTPSKDTSGRSSQSPPSSSPDTPSPSSALSLSPDPIIELRSVVAYSGTRGLPSLRSTGSMLWTSDGNGIIFPSGEIVVIMNSNNAIQNGEPQGYIRSNNFLLFYSLTFSLPSSMLTHLSLFPSPNKSNK